MGYQIFCFLSDSNTDSESEKMMNLLFLDSEMRSRAMLIAQASALNIEVSFGRCFFKRFSFMCNILTPTKLSKEEMHLCK